MLQIPVLSVLYLSRKDYVHQSLQHHLASLAILSQGQRGVEMHLEYIFLIISWDTCLKEFLPSFISLNCYAMMQAVSQQPVVASIDSTNLWNYRAPAILFSEALENRKGKYVKTDHMVLIVGYGETDGVKWWNCLNSWGRRFGDEGYFKIARGLNIRGIEQHGYFPIFKKENAVKINCDNRGEIYDILKASLSSHMKIVVCCYGEIFDGTSAVLKLASPNEKIELYSSLAGVSPCLPVSLHSSMSLLTDEEFSLFCGDLMDAIKEISGHNILIHFQGLSAVRAYELYSNYNKTHAIFIEDIHGVACLVVGGLIASLRLIDIPHKCMIYGSLKNVFKMASLIPLRFGNVEVLVVEDSASAKVLLDEIKAFKPSVLIGMSSSLCFDEMVVKTLCSISKMPIILAMGSITTECEADSASLWSDGNLIFASRFTECGENAQDCAVIAHIYPGVGLGMVMSGAVQLHDSMLLAAAEALASEVTEHDLAAGKIYPSWLSLKDVSASVAAAVALSAYELGLATKFPRPNDLHGLALKFIEKDV